MRGRCFLLLAFATAVASAAACSAGDALDPVTTQPAASEPAESEPIATEPIDTESAPPRALPATEQGTTGREQAVVRFVPDGDTIELRDGRTVRLVQIDAPEQYPPDREECFGDEARETLRDVVEPGDSVELEADESLDERDRFGRLLRYVYVEGRNVNLVLVRVGAAAPYFFEGERGRFADRLLTAAERAQAEGRGLWGACPVAELAPGRNVATGPPP